MSTHNIGFYEDLTKIIFELSSNTHLISSAENQCFAHYVDLKVRQTGSDKDYPKHPISLSGLQESRI